MSKNKHPLSPVDASDSHREIELKLQIDIAHIEHLKRHALLKTHRVGRARREQLVSTYYDTADCALRDLHAALRVRRTSHGWLQTFKSGGAQNTALTRRNEWEMPVAGAALELDALRELVGKNTRWGKFLRSAKLKPLFITEFERTIWDLHLPGGHAVELALDCGTIKHGRRQEAIAEVELELKAGHAHVLFDCALQLLDGIPLRIGTLSKAERGYALCQPARAPRAVTSGKLNLAADASVEDGLRLIVGDCVNQIEGNLLAVTHNDDPEGVHQMRIGQRRLQSALELFGKIAPLPAGLRKQLDWLSLQLGPARDWEVLAGTTLAPLAAAAHKHSDLRKVVQAAAAAARGKRAKARAALQSPQFTQLVLQFLGWLESAAWRERGKTSRTLDAPLAGFADQCLSRERRLMLKRREKIGAGMRHTHALHKLRLAAKAARYSVEFFASLYPAQPLASYRKLLATLQDELGRRNDAEVADRLLQELAAGKPELQASIAFARGHINAQAEGGKQKLARLLKRFAAASLPERKSSSN